MHVLRTCRVLDVGCWTLLADACPLRLPACADAGARGAAQTQRAAAAEAGLAAVHVRKDANLPLVHPLLHTKLD